MSFILDALRKAERERQWARVPTLETVHAAPPAPARRRWPWLAGAAALVVSAGVMAVLLRPSSVAPPPAPAPLPSTAPASAAALAPLPAPGPSPGAATAVPPPPAPSAEARALEPQRPVAVQAQERTTAPPPVAAAAQPAPSAVSPPVPVSPPVVPPPAPRSVPEARAPAVAAPEPVARPAPESTASLTLNALVYSDDPAERLVFINGRKYVEGQTVDGGALVESITREGVVLNTQGRRSVLR